MARLIDADALYEVVSEHVTTVSVCPTVDWARGKSQMKELCLEDIANAPTVGGWISVKDKLPEKSGRYIVYGCSKEMKEAIPECVPIWICDYSVKRGGWYSLEYNKTYDFITHWMLMPEPPKEIEYAEQ